MFFSRYHIIVFKEGSGHSKQLKLRGIMLPVVFLLLVALAAGNVFLYQQYRSLEPTRASLQAAEGTVRDQKAQLINLSAKLCTLERSISRVRDFNAKLRHLAKLDPEPKQNNDGPTSDLGGSETRDFSKNYLTLYRQELLARKVSSFLDQLSSEARLEEADQQELLAAMRERRQTLLHTPSIWPVEGWVSSRFGYRRSPFTGRRQFHKGLDISCPRGTPVYATANGTVTASGRQRGYGIYVAIDHGGGLGTRFGHLKKTVVKRGQVVKRGDIIAYSGNTGRSTGPHLHYEVRLNGLPVNPMRYILD